ncbi:hypothetical protein V6O07_05655 [Arthrospira platensis SPKY2]
MSKDELLIIYEDLRLSYNKRQSKWVQFHHAPDLETDILELDNELAQYYGQLQKIGKILHYSHNVYKVSFTASVISKIKYPRL